MIDLARRNAAKAGLANIEYHLATFDKLPLPDASADCVISNCVINSAPDRPPCAGRSPGCSGRTVSDIALKRELPPEVGTDLMAYVGCIAGAILIEDHRRMMVDTGFAQVEVMDSGKDLDANARVENQANCCSPPASALPIAEVGCCSSADESSDSPGS